MFSALYARMPKSLHVHELISTGMDPKAKTELVESLCKVLESAGVLSTTASQVCVCVCPASACVRACVRACVHACVCMERACVWCMCVCVYVYV